MNEPHQPQPATWVVQTIVAATRLAALIEPRAVDQILRPSITAHGVKLERRCDESSIYDRNCRWKVLAWVPGRVPASTRLGYQSDVWAVANRLCRLVWKILHEGMRFIEQGHEADSQAKKKRAQMLARALRRLGYEVTITPIRLCNFCSNGDILWWSSMEK